MAEDDTFEQFRDGRSGALSSAEEPRDASRQAGSDTEVREHLANERTLLSWVRTGVTLISIGLVVERAGALVAGSSVKVGSLSASALFGIGLASLGCLTLILGTVQFFRNRRSISEGNFVPAAAAYVAVVVGGLAFAGAFVLYVLRLLQQHVEPPATLFGWVSAANSTGVSPALHVAADPRLHSTSCFLPSKAQRQCWQEVLALALLAVVELDLR